MSKIIEALDWLNTSTVWEALEKWVDCQECVTLEFDTEAGTAAVRPCIHRSTRLLN